MKNLIILLIVLGILVMVIRLFVKRASARRGLMKPLLENRPVLDSTTESCTTALKKPPAIDTAIAVAIAAAVNATTPGARITRIEEEF